MQESSVDVLMSSDSTLTTVLLGVIFLAVLVSFVGGLMVLIAGFREGIGWGLGMLVPCVGGIVTIVFVIRYWPEARRGFLTQVAGFCMMVPCGFLLNQEEAKLLEARAQEQARQEAEQRIAELDALGAAARDTAEEGEDGATAQALEAEAFGPPSRPVEDPDTAPGDEAEVERADPMMSPERRRAAESGDAEPRSRGPRRVIAPAVGPEPPTSDQRYRLIPMRDASKHIGQVVEVITIEDQHQRGFLRDVRDEKVFISADVGGGNVVFSVPFRRVKELRIVL